MSVCRLSHARSVSLAQYTTPGRGLPKTKHGTPQTSVIKKKQTSHTDFNSENTHTSHIPLTHPACHKGYLRARQRRQGWNCRSGSLPRKYCFTAIMEISDEDRLEMVDDLNAIHRQVGGFSQEQLRVLSDKAMNCQRDDRDFRGIVVLHKFWRRHRYDSSTTKRRTREINQPFPFSLGLQLRGLYIRIASVYIWLVVVVFVFVFDPPAGV